MSPRAILNAIWKEHAWRLMLSVICLLVTMSVGLVLVKQAGAFQQQPGQQQAGQQAGQPQTGQQQPGRNQAQSRSGSADNEEVDPDMPPFARGLIEKREYLDRRQENVNLLRGLPYDQPDRRIQAIRQLELQSGNLPLINQTTWTEIGPSPIPNGQTEGVTTAVSGRTTAIAVHPTNPNIVYVGTAQGGVYRTLNGGASWTAIFDSALSLAIGSIAIAPSNPTIVYVGTGEPNSSCDSFFGVGIYRINNADTSPVLNGPFNMAGAADVFTGRGVGRVVVHPTNPDIIFASTTSGIGGLGCEAFNVLPNRGLFRSTNATGACTFTQMTTTGNASHVDVAMDPNNPNRVLTTVNAASGSGGGIYLSTDALAATPTFARTLTLNSVRSELALHSSGGTVTVYEADGTSNGNLRRSTDGGATWSAAIAAATGFCGGQCFYNISLAVDPNNANTVLLGGNVTGGSSRLIARSTNGGTNFTNVASGVHADNHAATFAPSDPTQAWIGTDGGIYKSTNNGASWTSMNIAGFMATQFMSVDLHPSDPRFSIGGTQDNGTNFLQPNDTWTRADFGDGGYAVIDQNAANTTNVTMYHTYFNQTNAMGYARVTNVANAVDNGWSFFGCGFGGTANGMTCTATAILFYAPMTRGPGNPNTLYFGSDVLYRSANSGTTMTKVSQEPIVSGQPITAIGIAPSNDSVRIVGLRNGTIWRTTTGSSTLTNVTGAGMPARFVGRIVIDPINPEIAYVGYTGFGVAANQHIWKTTNLSNATPTWTAAGSGIPDVPVNAMAIDPANPTHIYAGTDIAVYRSTDSGANWLPFGLGLPRVAVFDMKIQNANRILRIATHGRGLWEIQLGCAPITISPNTLTAGTAGTPYPATQLMASGGTSPYTFNVQVGALPTGMNLSPSGLLDGTPTVFGSFNFTVRATDNTASCFGEQAYTLTINQPCPTIIVDPTSMPNGTVGVSYPAQNLSASGGAGPYVFSVSAGSLPPGLNLVGGVVSGTPNTSGTFGFTIKATDANNCMGTRVYSVTIAPVPSNGLQFYPLAAPMRLLDTRSGQPACFTPGVPINGGATLTQLARNTCGIPANAQAVTGNVTVVTPPAGGFLTIYPSDATQPLAANTNYVAGEILNNVFTVGLGVADGSLKIFAQTTTHVVMDITGYYAPPATGGLYFHPLPSPVRLLETRVNQPGCFTPGVPITGGTELTQQGTGVCSGVTIPASAKALVGNATTVNPVAGGFLTFFPADVTRPLIATGNYDLGEILNSPFTVGLSATGQFKIYAHTTTDLVVDVLGYFSPDATDVNGTGLLFNPITPTRLLDTRVNQPGCFTPGVPLTGGAETSQAARGVCTIPATAQAIVGNATVVQPASGGFLTFWPSDATRPLVATSNYVAGDILNRHFTVGLGADGAFKMYAHTTTHLVIDVSGYFAP